MPTGANAFENIALAHREIYALYEIAQAMGTSLGVSDTMALISSKLSKLVPWSGCALFLQQSGHEPLRCRFAAGIDAPRLLNADAGGRRRASRDGWPKPAFAHQRRPAASTSKRQGFRRDDGAAVRHRLSAATSTMRSSDAWRCITSTPNHYAEDHRRLLERVAEQAGAVHSQLDRLRADAGRLADRSADGAAEPAVDVRPPRARARARRAAEAAKSRSS